MGQAKLAINRELYHDQLYKNLKDVFSKKHLYTDIGLPVLRQKKHCSSEAHRSTNRYRWSQGSKQGR